MRKSYSLPTLVLTAVLFLMGGLIIASCLDLTPHSTAQSTKNERAGKGSAQEEPAEAPMVRLPDFRRLARDLMPGVVNISTTKVVRSPFARGPRGGPRGQDPFEDFFNRFFQGQPREFKQHSLGSGFVIDKRGYILTNNHVVGAADEIIVTLANETEYTAKVVGKDDKTDLALIKIEPKEDLYVLPLGDSGDMEIGDWVLAIGNPFGLQHTVTAGIISAKGRVIGAGPYDDFIQTDASINPGNSGGPLINTSGKVIGINTAIFSQTGESAGIGFAIPINIARNVARQLQESGKVTRGWIGVLIQHIDPDLQKSYGLQRAEGALVSKVLPKSPASKAGLKQGDIILQYGDRPIRHHSDLPALVANTTPGTEVELVVLRDGKRRNVEIRIEQLDDGEAKRPGPPDAESEEGRLGLQLQELTPELARQFGVDKGALVAGVEPGSLAEQKGMQSGDIILQMNGEPIQTVRSFIDRVRKTKSGEIIRLLVKREDNQYFVALQKP